MKDNHSLSIIAHTIRQSIDTKTLILNDLEMLAKIATSVDLIVAALKIGGTIWFCGNGGSAADAQHLSAELSGRFYLDRKPFASEALHVNSSFMTAVANDFGFEHVYERMIEGIGKKGDVLVALSTSGNSPNIVLAVAKALQMGIKVIGLTGQTGGKLKNNCDILLKVPSPDTPRIQEAHIMLGHIICELVEKQMVEADI